MDILNIPFSTIEWGADEASHDAYLHQYFVEIPDFRDVLSGKKRYIIGRKGTGKTAILEMIRNICQNDPVNFYTNISLRDFPLNDFREMGDRSMQNKSKYVTAWEFLLLTEVAKMMMKEDNSVLENENYSNLRAFMQTNFPSDNSVADRIKTIRQRENKVSLKVPYFENDVGGAKSREVEGDIHYNRSVRAIKTHFKGVATDSIYYVLIDELDEGFQVTNKNLSLVILALIRAVEGLHLFFEGADIKCRFILALRSDIFNSLEDNDLNKIDDYMLTLDWTRIDNDSWSLKRIVNKRIEASVKDRIIEVCTNFQALNELDFWNFVAMENGNTNCGEGTINNIGLWKYICALTFDRPRDVIKLLKFCSEAVEGDLRRDDLRLSIHHVYKAERKYSNWFYNEFRDEVHSFLPCWKAALNCITAIGKGKESIDRLVDVLGRNSTVETWCKENKKTAMDIVEILFSYSVIGCVDDDGRWIFKYKDDSLEFMRTYPYYCVHYGLCEKLRINKNYRYDYFREIENF